MAEDSKSQKPMTQGQFHLRHELLGKMRGENETSHNEVKEDIRREKALKHQKKHIVVFLFAIYPVTL